MMRRPKPRQVVIIRPIGQYLPNERPHLEEDLIQTLLAEGYAVLPTETPSPGPSEIQVVGPSEIKQPKKMKKRHGN